MYLDKDLAERIENTCIYIIIAAGLVGVAVGTIGAVIFFTFTAAAQIREDEHERTVAEMEAKGMGMTIVHHHYVPDPTDPTESAYILQDTQE